VDVFVRTQRYENFGLAFVEAMACGTPVIASDAATAREVLGESGLLYKEGDPEDLADKILYMLKRIEENSVLGAVFALVAITAYALSLFTPSINP